MTTIQPLYFLVALVLLQGVLSMPSRVRRHPHDDDQGWNGGSWNDYQLFQVCHIVNKATNAEQCRMESCPSNSACKPDYEIGTAQINTCLPACNTTTPCSYSDTVCTNFTEADGTTGSYCLPTEDYGSNDDYNGNYDGGFDGSYDGAYNNGGYDDGSWWQYMYNFGFFGHGRKKRQAMRSCYEELCRLQNQPGDDGRAGNGGSTTRQTTQRAQTTTTTQPLFPNQPIFPGQNPGQNPGDGRVQVP